MFYQYNVLNLQTGMLVAVPIPEDQEADCTMITEATQQALKEAE